MLYEKHNANSGFMFDCSGICGKHSKHDRDVTRPRRQGTENARVLFRGVNRLSRLEGVENEKISITGFVCKYAVWIFNRIFRNKKM